jgi:mono/diheme cytochrome c family protein
VKALLVITISILFVFACGETEDETTEEKKEENKNLNSPCYKYTPDMYRSPAIEAYIAYGNDTTKSKKPKYTYTYNHEFENGLALFRANCWACHVAKPYEHRRLGAGLANISDKYEQEWLIEYIKSPKAMEAKGDTIALRLRDYDASEMSPQMLSDAEIIEILNYLNSIEEVVTY